jgi:hypothetical protein
VRRGCLHISCGVVNDVLGNVAVGSPDAIQEFYKNRVKQLNGRRDGRSGCLSAVTPIKDRVGYLGFRVRS